MPAAGRLVRLRGEPEDGRAGIEERPEGGYGEASRSQEEESRLQYDCQEPSRIFLLILRVTRSRLRAPKREMKSRPFKWSIS